MFGHLSNPSAVTPLTSIKENTMNELSNLHNSRSMSSREIAELTGKRHDNVVADIRRIIETLSGTTEMTHLKFQVSAYKDASGKSNVEYLLDYEATMLLVST